MGMVICCLGSLTSPVVDVQLLITFKIFGRESNSITIVKLEGQMKTLSFVTALSCNSQARSAHWPFLSCFFVFRE